MCISTQQAGPGVGGGEGGRGVSVLSRQGQVWGGGGEGGRGVSVLTRRQDGVW